MYTFRLTFLGWMSLQAGLGMSGCARNTLPPPPTSIPSVVPGPSYPATNPNPSMVPSTNPTGPSTPSVPIPPNDPSGPRIVPTPDQHSSFRPTGSVRDWQYIVIHHTATDSGSVESIHESHLKKKDKNGNPWLGIGYHFVIGNGNGMTDGAIEPTFRWTQQLHGAHAGSSEPAYNQKGIGICLVGNFEEHPPTPAQRLAVKKLVQSLKGQYRIGSQNVVGHKDIRTTECPGRLFPMSEVAGMDVPYADGQLSEAPVDDLAEVPGRTLR